jgi:hypothetical protein
LDKLNFQFKDFYKASQFSKIEKISIRYQFNQFTFALLSIANAFGLTSHPFQEFGLNTLADEINKAFLPSISAKATRFLVVKLVWLFACK